MVKRLVSVLACIGLLASVPAVTTALDEPIDPERVDWALTGYLEDGLMTNVPIGVDATLRLEDGTASGSGGCNTFSGGYELVDDSLTFDEALTRTLRACNGDADEVEDIYLSSLLEVVEWGIVGGELRLSDGFETTLTFELPGGGLTSADLAALLERLEALEAEVGSLDERLDNISIGKLRDRIRTLEADNLSLKQQLSELRGTLGPSGSVAFNAAERVLLEGVPARIESWCRPLRTGLPTGTAAAVQCGPNTSRVAEMAYYLMDRSSAVKLYDKKMRSQGLEPLPEIAAEPVTGCWEGNPGYSYAPGGYVGGVGCYVENGRANLRVIEQATACKQLKAGSKTIKFPVMYAALTGPDQDIQQVYDWAMRQKDNLRVSGLTVNIERPAAKDSPNCWAG